MEHMGLSVALATDAYFSEESDVASLRRRHRRCARDIAARMLRTSILNEEDRTPDVLSRPKVYRRLISRAQRIVQMSGCSIPLVFSHRLQKSG